MKAKMLKIAGVKTEAAFYKKYPTQEAFMKVHGKEFKKAQMGTLIGGGSPTQSVSKPMSYINYQELYDESDKLITGSTQAERDKAAADAAAAQSTSSTGGGGMSGVMGGVGDMLKLFGDEGMDMPDLAMSRYGSNIPVAQGGVYQKFKKPPIVNDDDFTPSVDGYPYQGPTDSDIMKQGMETVGDTTNPAGKGGGFMDALGKLDPISGTIGDIASGVDQYIAGQRELQNKKRDTMVSDFARMASATREEESKRRYVRPEDIQNTGEEFFPIYGVGTNVLTRNGGEIHRSQNGSMIGGNPTEIQNTYSNGYDIYTDGGYEPLQDPNQLKDFRHGGYLHRAQTGETGWQRWQNSMAGKGSGFSGSMAAGSKGASAAASGGGTPYGAIGSMATGVAQSAMGGQNAGGKIGGTAGKAIGSIWGPVGGMVGEVVGGVAGQLLDTTERDMKKEADKQKSNTQAMALNSGFQGLQESYNRYVRNGGDIPSYEDGGYMNPEYNPQVITMFGDHTAEDFADYAHKYRAGGHLKSYTPPSERAMETYAMGGQLQTHWGGGAETMSHNPYMPGSGETVLFRGQSHTDSDGNGQTGIGITYGENPVEVERGEPMFEMQAGGEINPETGQPETTGVVFGNMQIDKRVASQFNDPDLMKVADIYNGKKFKNVGIDLAKQEAKQNKIIDKNSKLIDSLKVETSLDKVRLAGLQAMLQGADTKLRDIADTKITLANYQNAINDAKEELSDAIGQNLSAEDLSRGYTKLDKDPVTKDAKWGSNIAKKAKAGATTTDETTSPPKSFKSEREANAAGYYKGEDGKYRRKIKKLSTEKNETKSASAMDTIPIQKVDKTTGLGEITPAQFEEFKKKNSWYDWSKFDPKSPNSVNDYAQKFNAEAIKRGSPARIMSDEIDPKTKKPIPGGKTKYVGKQFISADLGEDKKTTPVNSEEEFTAVVEEPTNPFTPEEKPKYPWIPLINQGLRYFTPTDQQELDAVQLYPEWNAMASNQLEPVPAQSYQPELIVPYDISLQAQRNSVMSATRNRDRQLGYNPAAQANMAPAEYNAINEINEKEFMANQGLKNQVYTGNVNTMNEAKKINLGIFADQWAKQSQARSNTKATTQAALNSIADKYAKNKLENRKLSIYENMYNYRFGKSGRAQNWNGLQIFDTTMGGGNSDKTGGLASGKEFTYDAAGNIVGVRSSDKDTVTDSDLEAVGGIKGKNGTSTKKNYKNSSVVRAFKNL